MPSPSSHCKRPGQGPSGSRSQLGTLFDTQLVRHPATSSQRPPARSSHAPDNRRHGVPFRVRKGDPTSDPSRRAIRRAASCPRQSLSSWAFRWSDRDEANRSSTTLQFRAVLGQGAWRPIPNAPFPPLSPACTYEQRRASRAKRPGPPTRPGLTPRGLPDPCAAVRLVQPCAFEGSMGCALSSTILSPSS